MTDTNTLTPLGKATDDTRRATRLFLAATIVFVGLVLTMAVGLADRQSAQDEVAKELGVDLDDIPPSRLGDILSDTWNTPAVLLIAALAIISTVLFSRAILAVGGVAQHQRPTLTTWAATVPYLGAAAFLGLLGAERALTTKPAWLLDNWWISTALLATFVLTVTISLVLAIIRIWPTGLARRTSITVLLLAVVLTGLTLTAAAPPVLPLVLATVFAFNLRRATATEAGPSDGDFRVD